MRSHRLVVALTGASGAILGIRLLQLVKPMAIETHLIVSPSGRRTIAAETDWTVDRVHALADVVHKHGNIGATVASGSFATLGMVVIPCSIKTLASIANCYADDLITRAADVTLKEGRPLVLVVRETPLHRGHLRQVVQAADAGAIIYPPVPAFYAKPNSVDDVINHMAGRVLARLGIANDAYAEWSGASAGAI